MINCDELLYGNGFGANWVFGYARVCTCWRELRVQTNVGFNSEVKQLQVGQYVHITIWSSSGYSEANRDQTAQIKCVCESEEMYEFLELIICRLRNIMN